MTRTASAPTRFLAGLSTLVLVLTVGFAALLLVGAITGFGPSGDDVAVHTRVDADELTGLPAGTVAPGDVDVAVRVRDATSEQHRWAYGRDLPLGLVVIIVLWLLRGLLRSVRNGDPFTASNVKRLRALAFVVLLGVPLAEVISSLFASELAESAGLDGRGVQLSFPGNLVLGGLAILVLAEVFAEGVRLRDDLEGTI